MIIEDIQEISQREINSNTDFTLTASFPRYFCFVTHVRLFLSP